MSLINVPTQKEWPAHRKTVKLSTGITMAYQEMGNTEKPVIIMAHGFSDSSRATRMISTHLAEDLHIYSLDLRGHGGTDKPEQFAYTSYQHMEDIVAFADAMGIETFYLMGISMGSIASQIVAYTHPERVKKLILLATGAKFRHTGQEVDEIIAGFPKSGEEVPALDELIPTHAKFDDQEFLTEMYPEVCAWPAHCWRAAWYGMEITDNSKFLQYIKASTLCFWGTEDDIFMADDQAIVMNGIPDVRAIWLDEASHEIQQEKHAEIAEGIKNFLNE